METPQVDNEKEAENYLLSHDLVEIVEESAKGRALGVNEKLDTREPFKPEVIDLCRLHRFIMERKRTTVLEFGVGWSTWVVADALCKLKSKYVDDVDNLRRNNPFELHVVDDEEEFLRISESRIPESLKRFVTFHEVAASMGVFNDRICSYYDYLPHVSPDFVYVDGPNQFSVKSDVGGWSTRHKDMMPMSGDLLRIEHFLTPGTVVVFDGRAANARFVKANLQRKWDYVYEEEYDQHVFELNEDPLGKYNRRQLEFYNS